MRIFGIFVLLLGFWSFPVYGEDDRMINLEPERQAPAWRKSKLRFAPGVAVQLPDGRRGIIETVLPNGQLKTDLGVLLLPDGSLVESPDEQAVIWDPEAGAGQKAVEAPKSEAIDVPKEEIVPEKSQETVETPAEVPVVLPQTPKTPAAEAPVQENPKWDAPEKALTLAELLPSTPAREGKQPAKKPEAQEQKKAELPQKAEKPKAETPKKEEPPKKAEKPKNGQELRIPEEAIKSGNLSFLEGCWEGRRPEYYSKRTIRECFCFDKNGGSGKRRIFDTQGNRTCIGSTRANLNKNGVLSVTSQGAACDDGERWGQAEMVCRNSGPKTPCSWVFRDAQNGRQAYTIPFVKVESCRR